jgi:hypothetical protein
MKRCQDCKTYIDDYATRCHRCTSFQKKDLTTQAAEYFVGLIVAATIFFAIAIAVLNFIFSAISYLATKIYHAVLSLLSIPWEFLLWVWGVVSNLISGFFHIADYPSIIIFRLLKHNFTPEWWTTAISLAVEFTIIRLLKALFTEDVKEERAPRKEPHL